MEILQSIIYYSFEDNNNITNKELRERLKELFKLIESEIDNLTDKDINQRRKNALKQIRENKTYGALEKNIQYYDRMIWDSIYILNRVQKEGLDYCPHCLSIGEPDKKINLERIKRYKKLNEKRYNRAKQHQSKVMEKVRNNADY